MAAPEQQCVNVQLNVQLETRLLARLDDFRLKYQFSSRAEAVHWLIKAALDQKLVPPKAK